MSLTYAIADLHGRFDLLRMALKSIAAHAADGEYKVVTLGDYVDRGPESRQVIQYLMEAQAAGRPLICLKGNHEEMMHETLTAPLDPDRWARNGGDTTLKSYNYDVPSDHLYWVKKPPMHADRHRIFVHAGIDTTKALDEQTEAFLLWYRYSEAADIGHSGRHVVHGHTPNPRGPEQYQNRTNLDTLAWRTGRLVVATRRAPSARDQKIRRQVAQLPSAETGLSKKDRRGSGIRLPDPTVCFSPKLRDLA